MRFNQQQFLPPREIDLIPMLTVMMGILAFFVMITMTLGNQNLINVQLPAPEENQESEDTGEKFNADRVLVIDLDAEGQASINEQSIANEQLAPQLELYLASDPENRVFVKPDRQLSFEKVVQMLGYLRQTAGERVSLTIE